MKSLSKFKKECEEITARIKQMGVNDYVVVDGVIDPERYLTTNPRILWILKETNSEDVSWSYLENFKNKDWILRCNGLSSIRRISYTSYGILKSGKKEWSEFPWSYEEECFNCLQDIALINIKKAPGNNKSDDNEIANAYKENRELLKKQIYLYDPEVIIFGNTMKYVEASDFEGLDLDKKQISVFGNHFYYAGKKLYINAWHPSCRGKDFTDKNYVMDIVNIVRNWVSRL
jgi:tRNA G10  N-methylase Trm11